MTAPKQTDEPLPTADGNPTARDILARLLDRANQARAVLLTSTDPEGPHQLRVALRMLRTALGVFAKGDPQAEALRDAARRLGRDIGHLRDLDVVAVDMVARARRKDPTDSGLWALEVALAEARQAARTHVRSRIIGDAGRALFLAWRDVVDGDAAYLDRPARPAADAALKRRIRSAGKRGRKFSGLDDANRHEFRKDIKKLRYTLDAGAWAGNGKRRRKFRKRIKALQDSLGAMNDVLVARSVLDAMVAGLPGNTAAQQAANRLVAEVAKQEKRDRKTVAALWKRVERTRLPG